MDSSVASLASLDAEGQDPQQGPKSFPFFNLPAELRLRVYEMLFRLPSEYTVDLDSNNYRRLAPLFLPLLLTSRRFHDEASRFFYSVNTFRLFPTQGRFFKAKRPLLARLPRHHREHITTMELRLGPGWNKPPAGWAVNERLGLSDTARLRRLRIFVECDPASSDIFRGFRTSDSFYTDFCIALLRDVLYAGESIEEIEFDAYPSVRRDSPLMTALQCEVKATDRRIVVSWGPQFREQEELEKVISRISSLTSMSDALAAVHIGDHTNAGFGMHASSLQVLSEA